MNEKLKEHIETLFNDAPTTRKAFELKEELLSNSEERYQDLVLDGVSPDNAIKNVIHSIGNVAELFQGLEEENNTSILVNVNTQKIALIKTVATGIYLLSIVIYMGIGLLIDRPDIGFIIMITLSIIPTCMLRYISNLYPKYQKQADTVVEDFKEWKNDSLKKKAVKNSTTCVLWTLTILIYFIVSFATSAWHVTWILFLVGLSLQAIINLSFHLKEIKK